MKQKNDSATAGQEDKIFLGDDLQQEMEKLSWEFLLKEKEEQNKKIIETVTEEEKYYSGKSEQREARDFYNYQPAENKNFDFWQKGDEPNINSLRRESGIIFNEEKLAKHRVVKWTEAPRLREPGYTKIFLNLAKIFLWPFKAAVNICVGMTTIIAKSVIGLVIFAYKILKGLTMVGWQILLAFEQIFIYIFGDFSWLKRETVEEPLAVENILIEAEQKEYSSRYQAWKMAVGFAAIALILVLPIQIYFFYSQAEKVKGEVLGASEQGIAHLLQAGIAGKELDMIGADKEFGLAGQEFQRAQNNFQALGILTNGAAAISPDVKAGDRLLNIAIKAADIGQILSRTGKVFGELAVGIREEPKGLAVENDVVKIKSINEEHNINWQAINTDLNKVVMETEEIEKELGEIDLKNTKLEAYSEKIEVARAQMPKTVSLLKNYRDLTKVFLSILGADEPKRWLLVFQNNTEIRPTGGFMGSYAVIDIKSGKIKEMEVPGGGFYDLKGSLAVQVDAPYPFHLFSAIWQPWNANWFPDWPATAEKIMWFYDKSGGPSVDGVISFTPDVLGELLELTGPIEMPEYKTVINADNFLLTVQTEVEFNYDKEENKPKKIIGDLLPKILDKALVLKGDQGVKVAEIFFDSLKEKNILVYFKNEENQKIVDNFGWSGRMADYSKDYLAIVHTNIAGGKTDMVVKNMINHRTEITNSGEIIDTVILTREHQGRPTDVFENSTNTDFVRFYVPQGSKLLVAEGFDGIPEGRQFQVATSGVEIDQQLTKLENNLRIDPGSETRIVDEFGKTSFGNWITVGVGESQKVTIKYLLPWRFDTGSDVRMSGIEGEGSFWQLVKKYFMGDEKKETEKKMENIYSLLIQKQSGTGDDQFFSTLTVGDKWLLEEYLPKEGVEAGNNSLGVRFDMTSDKYYGVVIKEK